MNIFCKILGTTEGNQTILGLSPSTTIPTLIRWSQRRLFTGKQSVVICCGLWNAETHWFHRGGQRECISNYLVFINNIWKSDLRDSWTSESSLMHEFFNWECWCLRSLVMQLKLRFLCTVCLSETSNFVFKDALDFFKKFLTSGKKNVWLWLMKQKRSHRFMPSQISNQ